MEVIAENCKNNPSCPHGPCLIFERHTANGAKTGRKFYACSACRDRSVCSFFHWVDDEISEKKKEHWEKIIDSSKPRFSFGECMARLSTFQQLPLHERKYCKNCSQLILPGENDHNEHQIVTNLTSNDLLQPTSLFHALQDKKSEAQYFFSAKTISFVISLLKSLHFTKLLLIGVPKIHEYVTSKQEENPGIQTLLLDIDERYKQFFSPENFCHYNLFNNHFFDGKASKKLLKQFLFENSNEKVAILIDPPFGGLIDAISHTLKTLNKWWRVINHKSCSDEVPVLWFFPYFLEPRIIKNIPNMMMMDYKVEYCNHEKFGKKAGSKGSPVRIFTNIQKSSFVLPKTDGYKFCDKCERYVSKENKHCNKCNSCSTKHGPTYKHCDSCKVCVKNSYVHCEIHNKCAPSILNMEGNREHKCMCSSSSDGNDLKCFKCFGYGHRKSDCPVNMKKNQRKRRK